MTVRYFRTSQWFTGISSCQIDLAGVRLRFLSIVEAQQLAYALSRRNPWSRAARERDFYVQKALSLGGKVVLEALIPISETTTPERINSRASQAEQIAFAGTIPWISRPKLHHVLGDLTHSQSAVELFIDAHGQKLSVRTKRRRRWDGVRLSTVLVRRFRRIGLHVVADVVLGKPTNFGDRMGRAISWLVESRLERSAESALLKTMIGFETLLGLDKSETLRQTISERVALLLGRDTDQRINIARAMKRLYDIRSAIVHGGRHTSSGTNMCEGADLFLLLALAALAPNQDSLKSKDDIQTFFEQLRWGVGRPVPAVPFPHQMIDTAVNRLAEQE